MIKTSAPEDSGVTDSITGKKISVTTSVRKLFRAANPTWQKVRNVVLNTAIANDFSHAKPQAKPFRVRQDANAVGQVRDASTGRYIAVITSNSVKIVAVSGGAPTLRAAPAPAIVPGQTPAPVALSSFDSFIVKHASDSLASSFGVSEANLERVLDIVKDRTGLSHKSIINQILNHKDHSEIKNILKSLCEPELPASDFIWAPEDHNDRATHEMYENQSTLPSSAFSLQVGILNS